MHSELAIEHENVTRGRAYSVAVLPNSELSVRFGSFASILACRPHVRLGGHLGNANASGAAAIELKLGSDETELECCGCGPPTGVAATLAGFVEMTATTGLVRRRASRELF
jgi:hypothetical protein